MDLTVIAIPVYFTTMGAEYRYLKAHAAERGPTAGDYERRDTIASLTMGTASLVVPLVIPKLLGPVTPGKGRYGKALAATALGAAAVTTVADLVARSREGALPPAGTLPPAGALLAAGTGTGTHAEAVGEADESGRDPADRPTGSVTREATGLQGGGAPTGRDRRRRAARLARKVASSGSVTALAAGVTAGATAWAARTTGSRLWARGGSKRDLGTGPLALATAIVGWDLIYYWNHRLQHETRFMWAIHVVHHSSEHYNLSTALRQAVADNFGLFVPYGALALLGVRPDHIQTARGVNLLYQYWVHTETIGKLPRRFETVFNTPSHHRVHHGSNRQYLDRNHAGILILWDRLFGTFEPEDEPVVYGLTRNIDTFDPVRIATHEYADIAHDVARSTTWRDRLSYVFRGPGWAYERRAALAADESGTPSPSSPSAPARSLASAASAGAT